MFAETREEYTQRRARLGITPASPVVKIKIPKIRDVISIQPSAHIGPMRMPDDDNLAGMIHVQPWRRIINEVAEKHGVTFQAIVSHRREGDVVAARHEAMWRMLHEENMSKTRIGARLGGRDHTTVLHGVRQHMKRMAENNVSTANKEKSE